jgi:uncharacterized membrane protein HdeD (DUF308 family)
MEVEVGRVSLPNWARTLAVIVGSLSIVAGFLVLIFPGLGVLAVVYILAFALIMLGVERLAMGFSGQAYGVKKKEQTPTA